MNRDTYIINYGYHNLYILTNLQCRFCLNNNLECGTIKYEVLQIVIKKMDITRLYSIICNNEKCQHFTDEIKITADCVSSMIKKYNKVVAKLLQN